LRKPSRRAWRLGLPAAFLFGLLLGLASCWNVRNTLNDRQTELAAANADLAQSRAEFSELRAELEAVVKCHTARTGALASLIESRDRRLSEAREALEQQRQTQQVVERAIEDLQAELVALRVSYEQSQLELKRLREDLAQPPE
jgi:chromosome segregation ATPase